MNDDPLTDEMRAAGWKYVPISEPSLSDAELRAVRKLIQANGLGEGPGGD